MASGKVTSRRKTESSWTRIERSPSNATQVHKFSLDTNYIKVCLNEKESVKKRRK
ncbi:uncharacterized protein LOC127279214 isoform X3 [Leptopilina boulardi]|uniref:uncharacterized protein LOC127279214 isoform X3 n=1 Tax=Leptopilina boulardi TaxID=63433 RepID=UPI0021F50F82|nr:uncharacterized protein LOC127279214 isoform X3 [Leptopilina boulardi]